MAGVLTLNPKLLAQHRAVGFDHEEERGVRTRGYVSMC